MNILLIGSGGREHALAWKIVQSPKTDKLYIAPGNAGTALAGKNVNIKVNDFQGLHQFAISHAIEMIVAGPEVPLVDGLHDYFLEHTEPGKIQFIGPVKKAAMLEGSKIFAKEFMKKYKIPTAASKYFDRNNITEAESFIRSLKLPVVIKADGLAAGKGVVISQSYEDAITEINSMIMGLKFGEASSQAIIEEFLSGIELSVFVATDGDDYILLPPAKDYKRIGEGDTGPNTGGMGSVSGVPFADKIFMDKVERMIIRPTIEGLKKDHIPYQGFIFFGLMNVGSDPYVIEYNVRLGDPEAEAVIPRIKSDIVDLFEGIANRDLKNRKIEISDQFSATIMLVSGGYPGNYKKDIPIHGTDKITESFVFHAGTTVKHELVTDGGRVLAITSLAGTLQEALQTSYKSAEMIRFDGMYFRKDIGQDLMKYL